MYTLRLLGSPVLAGPDGPVTGRVAQERKLALLAVLALSEGRSLTRDSLAAMFWPEAEAARARHSVADGLWVIRSALGDEALITRGNQVSLSSRVVATDVEAFEEALRAGELEEAVGAYAGPFMDGFHISGAPDFERWLDGKRARLAEAYAGALEHLVQTAREEGNAVQAVTWARRLVSADPLNTRRALLLMEVLAASGDVAGALLHGEAHGELLSAELGLPAPPEVEARIRELRTSPPAAAPAVRPPPPAPGSPSAAPASGSPSSAPAPGSPSPPPAPSPPSSAPAPGSPDSPSPSPAPSPASPAPAPPVPPDPRSRRSPPSRTSLPTAPPPARGSPAALSSRAPSPRGRRVRYASLAAGVGLVGMAAAWLIPGVTSGGAPETVPDRIVVVSFENRTGDPELDLVGRRAAEALVRGFTEARIGEVVLPSDLMGTGVGTGEGRQGPDQARDVAQREGAGIAVSGTVDPRPGGPVLTTTITAGPDGRVLAVLAPEPLEPAGIVAAMERLTSRAVGSVAAHLGHDAPELPFVVWTPSYESYRAADRATNLFLQRRYVEAASLFREAYQLDPTAVGYLLWEGVSRFNLADYPRVAAILDEIRPRKGELGQFDATQFDWLESRLLGDWAGALQACWRAHHIHPHSGVGGFQLGRELLRSGRPDEALEVLLALDPDRGWLAGWPFYWSHVSGAYHFLGRHEEELAAIEEGYRRHGEPLLTARLRALGALGRIEAITEAIRESTNPPGRALVAARALHRHGYRDAAKKVAEEGLRTLRASPPLPEAFPAARRPRMNVEAGLLMTAGQLGEARGVFLELLAGNPTDRDLLGWTGVVEARLGMEEEARARIRTLESLEGAPYTFGGHTAARAAIHAELGDDPARVRLLLEQSRQEGWPLDYFHFTPLFDPVRDHPDVQGFFELPR